MKNDQEPFPTNSDESGFHVSKTESAAVTQTGESVLTEPGNGLFLEKGGRTLRMEEVDTRPRSRLVSLCMVYRLAAFIFPLKRGKTSCSLSLWGRH